MRVVLDTNVLARAAKPGNDGPAFQVLQCVLRPEHGLCVSPYLLDELSRVLRYPRLQKLHGLADAEIDAFVLAIQAAACVVPILGSEVAQVVKADPKDDPVIATAVQASASVICTLDRHLFEAEVLSYCRERDISIVTDVELLHRLRSADRAH